MKVARDGGAPARARLLARPNAGIPGARRANGTSPASADYSSRLVVIPKEGRRVAPAFRFWFAVRPEMWVPHPCRQPRLCGGVRMPQAGGKSGTEESMHGPSGNVKPIKISPCGTCLTGGKEPKGLCMRYSIPPLRRKYLVGSKC
jgi:hypothetical protein